MTSTCGGRHIASRAEDDYRSLEISPRLLECLPSLQNASAGTVTKLFHLCCTDRHTHPSNLGCSLSRCRDGTHHGQTAKISRMVPDQRIGRPGVKKRCRAAGAALQRSRALSDQARPAE